MIRVEGLVRDYAAFRALHGINFVVEPGEIVGFLGPNGAGKTTTLRILSGFMPASEGKAEIAGFDVSEQSRDVRLRTGYLPEDVPLYRDLTVEVYLRYLAGLKEVAPREVTREVERVISLTGLQPVQTRLLAKCSKGFRQRTGLAQALLGDPPVLLMDEPTSGLDPNQVVSVRDLIRDLSGEKTVLLSSHILPEVAQICQRVLIIAQGRLVGSGTPAELAARTSGGDRLEIELDRGMEEEDQARIRDLGLLTPLGEARYRLDVASASVTAPEVARLLVERGYGLRALTPGEADLEAVFRRLTTGDAPHA